MRFALRSRGAWLPVARLVYAEQFVEDMVQVGSAAKRKHILDVCGQLAEFPLMGSADVPFSLLRSYGPGLRKLSVRPFVMVCRYDEDVDTAYVPGLAHSRAVR